MAAGKPTPSVAATKTKKFGKGERTIPGTADRARRFYPAEDEPAKKLNRKTNKATHFRASLTPGAVLILLAGRFRGKRVILLKTLSDGVLLVTGPFKVNGVPLRRVNARYVIATSQTVDLKGVDSSVIEKASQKGYFTADKKKEKAGEEAFFKQGEKPEKKKIASTRAADQKAVDKALLATIKKTKHLTEYLGSSFSLRHGDRPHAMRW